jgi:hypothetical protein
MTVQIGRPWRQPDGPYTRTLQDSTEGLREERRTIMNQKSTISQNSNLLSQVFNHLLLIPVHPAGQTIE